MVLIHFSTRCGFHRSRHLVCFLIRGVRASASYRRSRVRRHGWLNRLYDKERIMAKGNNSQKNDKKDKKVKKDSKKTDAKK